MLSRRLIRQRPCPDRLSPPLSIALPGPPLRGRPAVGRRCLASVSTSFDIQGSQLPAEEQGTDLPSKRLQELLRSIRRREAGRVVPHFLSWVNLLHHERPQVRVAAAGKLQTLPAPVLSEILRNIDPFSCVPQDPARGLNLTSKMGEFTNSAAELNDNFGVRVQYVSVVDALKLLMKHRIQGQRLLIPDYEVFIRCAGAASDLDAAVLFWGAIAKHGHAQERNTRTFTEFLKARYMTEPLYYQYDRDRVLVCPPSRFKKAPPPRLDRLERARLNFNAMQVSPINRTRRRTTVDNLKLLQDRYGFYSFQSHFWRAKDYGILFDEDYLTTGMMAAARSYSTHFLRKTFFTRYFKTFVRPDSITSTREYWRPHNPRQATSRFLHVIVESLGSMGLIRLAIRIMVFTSQHENIPLQHEHWSNLLQWAFVAASKRPQRVHRSYRRVRDIWAGTLMGPRTISDLWDVMTSQEFGVRPSFDDYSVYAKILIIQRDFASAVDVIRTKMIPRYYAIAEEHEGAVLSDLLRADAGEDPTPSYRRRELEARKEYTWFQIQHCLDRVVTFASMTRRCRETNYMHVDIPNLMLEFDEFFPRWLKYRTKTGYISFTRPGLEPRFEWHDVERTTLPEPIPVRRVQQKVSRRALRKLLHDPWRWPAYRKVLVRQWTRQPRPRVREKEPPPELDHPHYSTYWDNVEKDLMI